MIMKRYSNIDDWRIFRLVAQTGSIQRAADKMGVDASSISRTISSLEKSLQVALVDRHQRPFGLTNEGQEALAHCDKIIQEHDLMLEQLLSAPDAMKGTLRVGIPPAVLDNFLIGPLAKFHETYPELALDVIDWHSPLPISFVSPNGLMDVVCGYGPDPDSPNIVQIAYGAGWAIPCASPIYIKNHGYPDDPDELITHTGITFHSPMRKTITALTRNGLTKELHWDHEIQFYSAQAAKNATIIGSGIHSGIPTLHSYREFIVGGLKPVLPGWCTPPLELYIYVRPESLRLRRVRTFIRWFCDTMGKFHQDVDRQLEPVLKDFFKGTDWQPIKHRGNALASLLDQYEK